MMTNTCLDYRESVCSRLIQEAKNGHQFNVCAHQLGACVQGHLEFACTHLEIAHSHLELPYLLGHLKFLLTHKRKCNATNWGL